MLAQNFQNPTSANPIANPGPRRAWYALPALLLLMVVVSIAIEIPAIARNLGHAIYFLAPGTKVIPVDAVGSYTIWHENRILFGGRTYDSPAALPGGVTFTVTGPRGESIAVTPAGGASVTSGSSESHEVATFEATAPGNYTLTVAGLPDPHVISVSNFTLLGLMTTITFFTLLQLILTVSAITILVVIAIRRYRNRRLIPPFHPSAARG